MKHAFAEIVEAARLPATGWGLYQANGAASLQGRMIGWGTVIGLGLQGWAPGAIFFDLDASAGARVLYNAGSTTAASWKTMGTTDAANTWAALQTFTLGAAITSADLLTVGGIIVPQHLELVYHIPKIAGDLLYTCFSAARAYTVTNVRYVPNILQGGAMTVTPVKMTVNAAPSAGTTPLLTAAFDGNTAANTTQVGTLTATGADLVLAAGDKLGVVLSTASTVGQSDLFISLKRS